MKLSKYIKALQKIAEQYPNAEVVYSKDDEGNDFQSVSFEPTLGNYKDGDFIPKDQFEDYENDEYYGDKLKINSVCVN